MPQQDVSPEFRVRLLAFLTLLGLFLTVRGYRSFEGDQAYRLPILLHGQAPEVYRDDPFVRSFDHFNPHRGSLALLGAASAAVGLPWALAGLFVATFLLTCYGFDRLARSVSGKSAGLVAVVLLLLAQAGNIGTNHLFEPLWLDRLPAFGLGWLAVALAIGGGRSGWLGASACLGLATLVHPSIGLQLAMLVGVSRGVWLMFPSTRGEGLGRTAGGLAVLGLALVPGLAWNLRESGRLMAGAAPETVRLLAAELQGPQHMLPHLWRMPQWLAWACYPVLAVVATAGGREWTRNRARFAVVLGVNLLGLAVAWFGIEWAGNVRLTLFQPFRMATVARGLCLVFLAGHVVRLWSGGGRLDRCRAVLFAVGLTGDWSLVVVTLFEVTQSVADRVRAGVPGRVVGVLVLAGGLVFLSRHDTESGQWPLLASSAAALVLAPRLSGWSFPGGARRAGLRLAAVWTVPVAALVANLSAGRGGGPARLWLVRHCRFAAVAVDDVERLALWCREHTPGDARFVGPPGPKTFRLWSRRCLAFNRAGSPYEAEALVDWADRFREHVAFEGSLAGLVRAYQSDRHGLERRYEELSDRRKAELARRQGAGYVVAEARGGGGGRSGALTLLHAEGRYAVYRVNDAGPSTREARVPRPAPDFACITPATR
jgi:hypothetical protein